MRTHVDDRRLAYFDVFPTHEGDLNVMHLYDGALSAWHRHGYQDDWFFCVRGAVRFGVIDEQGTVLWAVRDERAPGPFVIPAKWWHGYQAFGGPATLVMWSTNKWNGSDEERKSVEDMGIPWSRTVR